MQPLQHHDQPSGNHRAVPGVSRYVGNLAADAGCVSRLPRSSGPLHRHGRELVMMRWGMQPPPRTGGPPVTNIRNTSSPHWRGVAA